MFTWKGITSDSMGVKVQPYTRALHPAQRVIQTYIQGRHGTFDTSDGSFENGTISLPCVYFGSTAPETIRAVAAWLTGTGKLSFNDEPDKHYNAKIWASADLTAQLFEGLFTISWTVFPFALGDMNEETETLASSGDNISVVSGGTAMAPCTIAIVNRGTESINNISVTLSHEL